jgi:hypothetical protein
MKRNDTNPPASIEAELAAQMTRVTQATLAATVRAHGALRHQEVAHMVRLAGAASDVMLASTRLARASARRRKPKVTVRTYLLEN